MPAQLIFEHPLNERVRTFMRLEHLFGKVANFSPQEDPWTSRIAVEGVIDILGITARSDIKSELLKELERNSAVLTRLQSQTGVDLDALGNILDDLKTAATALKLMEGQIGQPLRKDAFLTSIAKRSSIPGGTCSFDLPHYHYWLAQSPETRRQRLEEWMQSLQPVSDAITLVLSLARTSAAPRRITAVEGFFQESVDTQAPAQLVRVALDDHAHLFPEISGHKNRYSIRFMDAREAGRAVPWREDIVFNLTCCVF